MSLQDSMLPAYGGRGDISGALRRRWAFRFLVIAWFAFAMALFLAETQLSHDHTENLYRDGLTMDPASGRVLLRNAIKAYDNRGDIPPDKYLQALAEREQDDLKLTTYARAYELERNNPDTVNPDLLIRYGARLFQEEKYAEARDRFNEAVQMAPGNALPAYLEAAATMASAASPDDMGRAIATLTRTNTSTDTFVLPRVLWFQGLPRNSKGYSDLQRQLADECVAPLYSLAKFITAKAPQIAEEQGQEQADIWLSTLDGMGQRILASEAPTANLAVAAVTFQLDAVRTRLDIASKDGQAPDERLYHRRLALETALHTLLDFESTRDEKVSRHAEQIAYPLWRVMETIAWLCLAYAVISLLTFLLAPRKDPWSLPLGKIERFCLWLGPALLALLVLFFTLTTSVRFSNIGWLVSLSVAWRVVLLALLLVAIVGPAMTLPKPRQAIVSPEGQEIPDDMNDDLLKQAREQRRQAILIHGRRYVGQLLGRCIIVACVWLLIFRIVTGSYPHHGILVATGLISEEQAVVHTAIAALTQST